MNCFRATATIISLSLFILISLISSMVLAVPGEHYKQDDKDELQKKIERAVKEGAVKIELKPIEPENSKARLRWSPKGTKIRLTKIDDHLAGQLQLGEKIEIPLELRIGPEFATLRIDANRDGTFSDDESKTIRPSKRRNKTWYSTSATIRLPFGETTRPYPISLWHVVDPEDEPSQSVIRFSRRGWHQGTFEFAGKTCYAMISDRNNDGLFGDADAFGLGTNETETFEYKNTTNRIGQHGWLGEIPFRVTECEPDGQFIVVEAFDLGLTRDEDLEQKDPYLADRKYPRATTPIQFLDDFDQALEKASNENKLVVLDFVTSWCGPCRVMDQLVYTAEPLVNESQDFVFVKIDGDEKKDLVKRFDVKAYPTIVIVDENSNALQKATGYQSVQELRRLLKQAKSKQRKPDEVPKAEDLKTRDIRVLSYNIRRGLGMDNQTDLNRTIKVLKRLNADVVGLQEVDRNVKRSGNIDQPAELAKQLNMHVAFAPFLKLQGGEYGMAVLSRFPIRSVREINLPRGNEPRVALAAELELPNSQSITLINVHFDWVQDDAFRFAQASALAKELQTLRTPYLLVGDFNDQPKSRTIELFSELATEANKPQQNQSTYPARAPSIEIDFIFYHPKSNWRHTESQVIRERMASDHRPVLSEFELLSPKKDPSKMGRAKD